MNTKQATITGAASTVTSSDVTGNRALISNNNGKIAASDITTTELGYLDGVTSNIQTQLNGKQASGSYANTSLSNVSSNIDYVIESGTNYKKFKSGLLIQWGTYDNGSIVANITASITYPKAFSNTNYSLTCTCLRGNDSDVDGYFSVGTFTNTGFSGFSRRTASQSGGTRYIKWFAIGF